MLKTNHPNQDETEMRLSKIEANETRPGQECPKFFHLRQDQDETSSKILYETQTRPRVSVSLVSRPRLLSFTALLNLLAIVRLYLILFDYDDLKIKKTQK